MKTKHKKLELEEFPRADARIKRIVAEINRHEKRPDALIEVLHIVEDIFGYVPLGVMVLISHEMKVPPSRVYGVVTFYHFFSLKPKGEHNCLVCLGTACYVKGAQRILDQIEKDFGITAGATTPDGRFGLQMARCLGSCGLAPAVVLDNEVHAKVDPLGIVKEIREKLEAKK